MCGIASDRGSSVSGTCNLTAYVLQDIGAAWKTLENAEKGFEEWLLSEMQRCVCSAGLLVCCTASARG